MKRRTLEPARFRAWRGNLTPREDGRPHRPDSAVSSSACIEDDTMTPPHSHITSACRCGPRTPADAPYSVVRVKGSAGPVKGELEVTSSEPQGSPVSTAIAVLVLVTAAVLAAVAVGVVGWLVGFPAVAAGLAAFGALALIFGVGLYITYWKVRPGAGHENPR